jgi:hypothetical protein
LIHADTGRDQTYLLLPLCFAAAILIPLVPWLHPVGTCSDWLFRWGQLLDTMREWVLIHKVGMIGFALAAGIGIFFPLLGPRSFASVAGGTCMALGAGMMSMLTMIHATATSTIGKAYNAATSATDKKMLQSVADAFVSFDVAGASGSSFLISFGCMLMIVALWQRKMISTAAAAFMVPLGFVWTAQYHHVFNRLGFSISEQMHWASLGLWLAAFGVFTSLPHWRARRAAAGGEVSTEEQGRPTELA